MALHTKSIKRRIKSVSNTKKITKAMEMISAVKMKKATEAALNTRTYATLAWDLLVKLSKTQKEELPLLETRTVHRLLLLLFTSNRGLCGSFNSNIIKKTAAQVANPKNISSHRIAGVETKPCEEIEIDVISVGKKGAQFAKKMGCNLIASFTDFSDTPKLTDVLPICKMAIDEYQNKKYDKVVVAYTDYKSTIIQTAKLRQVLPISEIDLEKMLEELGDDGRRKTGRTADGEHPLSPTDYSEDYLFEPDKNEVLKIVLPRLVETQIYQASLESAASEHSARMMAMRNASDAAEDMINELNLNFNKARQASITQEIAEIAGGAAALG